MPLVALAAVVLLAALLAAAVAWRYPRAAGETVEALAETAGEQRGLRPFLRRRRDPVAATGLALTIAFAVVVLTGLALALLAYLVRGHQAVLDVDSGAARWGFRSATPFTNDVLNVLTQLGDARVVIALVLVVAVVESIRVPSRYVVPFLLAVTLGNHVVTNTVKEIAHRARPTLNPIAQTLGPSFPSGHSSTAAAFYAAAALLLGRRRGHVARTLLAALAVAIPVAVASTRVLLDVHWVSDVIAGLALGWGWFALCAIAFGGRLLEFGAPAEDAAASAREAPPPRSAVEV
jgi:membrane-associated phospholipid phosphatase